MVIPKGFIEIREAGKTFNVLINVNAIECVWGHTVYLRFCVPGAIEQDNFCCEEDYDEIVAKIAEAMK